MREDPFCGMCEHGDMEYERGELIPPFASIRVFHISLHTAAGQLYVRMEE